ncbi:MAG: AAA family ATPase [Rhodobacteraceae bacterium]|nr:AAA family ATPase [Paracoccaceae bacterium]
MNNDNQNPVLDNTPAADGAEPFDPNNVEHVLQAASDHCFPEDDEEAEKAANTPPKSSQGIIASWIIHNRLAGPLKPIFAGKPHCLLIEVPEQSWCEPLCNVIKARIPNRSIFKRYGDFTITPDDGPSRRRDAYIRDKAISCLSRGDPLVISVNNAHANIPQDVMGIVDEHVVLTPLRTNEIIAIIEEMTRSSIREPSEDLASGLTFDQICGAIRIGDNPTSMINRLKAMRQVSSKTRAIAAPMLADMAGYGEAKEWGLRLAREVDRYRAGAIGLDDLPRGLLLSGPPGCGKTLYAQSLAATCSVPIIATSVADWLQAGDGHLGDVLNAVKKVFDDAHQKPKPAILFLDECDAFIDPTKTRDRSNWWNTLRAGVLSAIDGASTEPGLIVVGACNYPDQVDPALRRSGRLDRHIRIPLPDADALSKILKAALGVDLPDLDYERLGQLSLGSTGADIARSVREIRARARDHGRPVSKEDVEAVLVPADSRPASLVQRIAIHESAHAIVAHCLGRRVRLLSLSMKGDAIGGYAMATRPHMYTRKTLHEEVMICFAGRAAEIAFGLEASSGASADLAEATNLITRAHAVYGFGQSLAGFGDDVDTSKLLADHPKLVRQIDADLHRLWHQTTQIIDAHFGVIHDLAHALIKHRHFDEAQFLAWIAQGEFADYQAQAC